MELRKLSQRTRNRLTDILAEDQLDSHRILTRLRELRALEGGAVFAAVLYYLAHLEFQEPDAEAIFVDLLAHRRSVADDLGRDPGLRVAAIDFLTNVRRLLNSPTIVESGDLEKTRRSAVTDPLTELYNRRHFQHCIEIELKRCERYSLDLSVLMLDLDSFKAVNDLYGHPFGDLVLNRTGKLIRRAVRESDVACRFGGEEFAVILPETDRLGAYAVAERVRRRIQAGFAETMIEGRAVAMTISGGISSYPDDGKDSATLVAWADQALYHSKERGKNRITVYHAEQRRAVRFPVRSSARTKIGLPGNGQMHEALTINLSESGVLLSLPERFGVGDGVEIELDGADRTWRFRGQVVRVDTAGGSSPRHLVAVAFESPLPDECLRRHAVRQPRPEAPQWRHLDLA